MKTAQVLTLAGTLLDICLHPPGAVNVHEPLAGTPQMATSRLPATIDAGFGTLTLPVRAEFVAPET
jgi:hypothetical protein